MTEQESVKQSADLLRRIIRSIDKRLDTISSTRLRKAGSLFDCRHAGGKEWSPR